MRLTLTTASLGAGGADRVLTEMVRWWAEKGWEITVLTTDDGSVPPFFPLPVGVAHVPMNTGSAYGGLAAALVKNIRAVGVLRREVRASRPQCVIAFGETCGVRAILAARGMGIPVIVSEHSVPDRLAGVKGGRVWNALRSMLYPFADAVVFPSTGPASFFAKRIRRAIRAIPNPVPSGLCEGGDPALIESVASHTVASMGRFVREKRFDLLLRAFARVAESHECTLLLVGDGPLRPDLERLAQQLKIADRVRMPGFLKDPWRLLRHADLFVVSSEAESFSMVIVEAMACGVPVVSFDCPTGPAEIIRDRVDGILVPLFDVNGLAEQMEDLLANEHERTRVAARAAEVRERFSREKVMAQWDALVESACRAANTDARAAEV